jgi:hypothetical protein
MTASIDDSPAVFSTCEKEREDRLPSLPVMHEIWTNATLKVVRIESHEPNSELP